MKILLKYFYDSLNIVVILAAGNEFFLLNLPNFLFDIYGITLNEEHISFRTVIIHF